MRAQTLYGLLLTLAGAALSNAALAQTNAPLRLSHRIESVYQKAPVTGAGSVELSNIEEPGTGQTALVTSAVPGVRASPPLRAEKGDAATVRERRKSSAKSDTTEAGSVTGDDANEDSSDKALANRNPDTPEDQRGAGAPMTAGSGLGNFGSVNPATVTAPGSSGSAVGGTGSQTASSVSSLPSTATVPRIDDNAQTQAKPITSALDPGLASMLQQYRQLMLQEATAPNAINGNPALTRRYLQIDRNTYLSTVGTTN